MGKVRLDALLHARGLFGSRSQAAAAVMAGEVRVGAGRRLVEKPGHAVAEETEVEIAERPRFVSRGGVKLSNALDELAVPVAGRSAVDVGASTGGFTDCLLQRGAARVACVDVGYGELDYRLRTDPRVTVLERTNARRLEPGDLPFTPDLAVCDLSFIALGKVLPALARCLADRHDVLAMVKPQFEVGRERVGRGGVVRDPALRRQAVAAVGDTARELGFVVVGAAPSGLPGPKGNRETFLWLADGGRRPALDADRLVALLGRIDPDAEGAA